MRHRPAIIRAGYGLTRRDATMLAGRGVRVEHTVAGLEYFKIFQKAQQYTTNRFLPADACKTLERSLGFRP